MATQIARDPKTDHLLTPENSALILIDFQPGLIDGARSVRREILVNNVLALAKTGSLFKLPIVLSTVAVSAGYQEDTIAELKSALPGVSTVDRSKVNAWEEPAFREAVIATGRRKLIMAGLWTEVCLVFPALDLLTKVMRCTPCPTRPAAPALTPTSAVCNASSRLEPFPSPGKR